MTMVSSGPISIGGSATTGGLNQSINIELGRSATATSSLNETALRTLAGVPSGAISLSNFYGKANEFAFTISSNQADANLRTLAVNAGWNQSSAVRATINSGVQITSNSTGTPALTISGSFPGGVALVNNGAIYGRGGNAGNGGASFNNNVQDGNPGSAGGTALSASVAAAVTNNGTIAGGGGGGGGGAGAFLFLYEGNYALGGGGGGGGAGVSSGGSGGGGQSGGGYPGGPGALTSAGGGGGGGVGPGNVTAFPLNSGGNGGGNGAAGSNGVSRSPRTGGAGGAAGAAVSGNANITWVAFGTRLGPIV